MMDDEKKKKIDELCKDWKECHGNMTQSELENLLTTDLLEVGYTSDAIPEIMSQIIKELKS